MPNAMARVHVLYIVAFTSGIVGLIAVFAAHQPPAEILFNFGLLALGVAISLFAVNILVDEVVEARQRRRDLSNARREVDKVLALSANVRVRLSKCQIGSPEWTGELRAFVKRIAGTWASRSLPIEDACVHLSTGSEDAVRESLTSIGFILDEMSSILSSAEQPTPEAAKAIAAHFDAIRLRLGRIQECVGRAE